MATNRGLELNAKISVDSLISAFYYKIPIDFSYSGESHSGWEFVYVDKGRVKVGADDATYILKKGEMVCHKPYEFHTIRPHESDAAVIIFCFETTNPHMSYFNNKILSVNQRQRQYVADLANLGDRVFLPKDPLDIARDGQMDASLFSSELDKQSIKNTLELLIISLLGAAAVEKKNRISLYEQASRRKTLTENIISYLIENIENEVKLETISKHFSYSLSSIKRIFKEETGVSVINYLCNLRLEQAARLLHTSELSIGEIAIRSGFANTYYFSNSFKKRYGVSPMKFRKDER